MTEIAAELGVPKSTASRLVAVLEGRGFVEQLADRGKYRLGFGIVRLAGALTVQRDLAHESRRACEALAAGVGETVNVAILDGDRVINISEIRGPAAVALHTWVGQSTPPHATSSGKVLLAHAALDLRALLGDDLPRFTPHTVTNVSELLAQLDEIRSRGWAATVGVRGRPRRPGRARARPHRDRGGRQRVRAVVPPHAVGLPAVAERLLVCTADISRRLGHLP